MERCEPPFSMPDKIKQQKVYAIVWQPWQGPCVAKDTGEALKWFQLAAISGDTLARISLAALKRREKIADDFDVP